MENTEYSKISVTFTKQGIRDFNIKINPGDLVSYCYDLVSYCIDGARYDYFCNDIDSRRRSPINLIYLGSNEKYGTRTKTAFFLKGDRIINFAFRTSWDDRLILTLKENIELL